MLNTEVNHITPSNFYRYSFLKDFVVRVQNSFISWYYFKIFSEQDRNHLRFLEGYWFLLEKESVKTQFVQHFDTVTE